jgi:hypothetical protein
MASKRCGCASDACTCVITAGTGIVVSGGGTQTNPYVLDAEAAPSSLVVQDENTVVRAGVTLLDFQGGGVGAAVGDPGEVIVTIPAPPVPTPVAAGIATTATPSALNTPTSVNVTFPAGRFTAAPVVTANIAAATPSIYSQIGVASITSTGMTLWVTQLSGTLAAATIHWHATKSG